MEVTLLDKTTQTESVEMQHKESQTNIMPFSTHTNNQAYSIQDSQQEGKPINEEDKKQLPLDQSLQSDDTTKVCTRMIKKL